MNKEKILEWDLGHYGDLEPNGYIIVETDGSHSHWSMKGEWKYGCGGKDCISRAREHNENKKLITNKTMKFTNLVKKLLDEKTRTLIKAGFVSDNLELTEEGVSELLSIFFLEKKEELVKIAERKINELNK